MRLETKPGNLDRRNPAVDTTIPPQQPGRHRWAELLRLVGDVRRLAYDRSLARDAFGVNDGIVIEDEAEA